MDLHKLSYLGHLNEIESLKLTPEQLNKVDDNKCTALHLSCAQNHTPTIKYLIQSGADINVVDCNLTTPLHWLAYNGNYELVQLFIEKMSCQIQDANGIQPIHLAALNGHTRIVELFLRNELDCVEDKLKVTPLHMGAFGGHVDTVRVLLDSRIVDVDVSDSMSITPLLLATSCNFIDVVKLLMNSGASWFQCDNDKHTPLCWAAVCGNIELLELLLNNESEFYFSEGYSALFLATKYGHWEAVKFLLKKKQSLNLIDGDCEQYIVLSNFYSLDELVLNDLHELLLNPNFLHWVSAYCCGDTLKVVFADANVNELDHKHNTPLMTAAAFGNVDAVRFFLANDCDLDEKDEDECTALCWCIAHGYLECVKLLVDAGADKTGAMMWAAAAGHVDIVQYLIDIGMDVLEEDDDDEYSRTPLMWAATCGQTEMIKFLIDHGGDFNNNDLLHWCAVHNLVDSIKLLLDHGVNVNDSDLGFNRTALHWAAMYGNLDAAKYLLDHGADVNAIEDQGDLPIHYAVFKNHVDMVKLLIEHGAQLDRNGDLDLPLVIAARDGFIEIIKILLSAGVDINQTEVGSETAVQIAQISGQSDVVQLLIEHGCDRTGLLFTIAEDGQVDDLKMLVQLGDDLNIVSPNGGNALAYSARRSLPNTKFLVEYGLNVNCRNRFGETPLFDAIIGNQFDCFQYLIEHGADVNVLNKDGESLLMRAITYQRIEFIKYLDRFNPNYEQADADGNTPFHIACRVNSFDLVKFLISKHVNINAVNANRNTPLHDLATNSIDTLPLAELLLANGAVTDVLNKDTDTPLSISVAQNNKELTRLLIVYGVDVNLDPKITRNPVVYDGDDNEMYFIRILYLAGLKQVFFVLPLYCTEIDCSTSIKEYIKERQCKPYTLKQMCRIVCRTIFKSKLVQITRAATLPETVRDYLLYKHLD